MPFASFLRRSLLAAGLFGLLAGFCAASVEAADARQEVTIGLVDTFSPDFYIHTYAPTLDNLIEALPQYAFRIVEIDFRHLNDDIARTRPAFLVTSASTFVSLIEKTARTRWRRRSPTCRTMSPIRLHPPSSFRWTRPSGRWRMPAGFARPFSRARALTAG